MNVCSGSKHCSKTRRLASRECLISRPLIRIHPCPYYDYVGSPSGFVVIVRAGAVVSGGGDPCGCPGVAWGRPHRRQVRHPRLPRGDPHSTTPHLRAKRADSCMVGVLLAGILGRGRGALDGTLNLTPIGWRGDARPAIAKYVRKRYINSSTARTDPYTTHQNSYYGSACLTRRLHHPNSE